MLHKKLKAQQSRFPSNQFNFQTTGASTESCINGCFSDLFFCFTLVVNLEFYKLYKNIGEQNMYIFGLPRVYNVDVFTKIPATKIFTFYSACKAPLTFRTSAEIRGKESLLTLLPCRIVPLGYY